MPRAVTISNMAFRALWIINVILGILDAFTGVGDTQTWINVHMLVGILLVALLWFIGIAEGLQARNVLFPIVTFLVGLLIPIIGVAQTVPADGTAAQYILRGLHILLIIGAIAIAEIATARYKRAQKATQAAA